MATKSTTTTKKTTTTRAKKPVEPKVEETPVVNNNDDLIAQLMEQIKLQNEKMAELQAQIDNNKAQQVVVAAPQTEYTTKKIKLVNLMHNPLNLSTEPNGRGRVFTFQKFGDTRLVKFDDLSEIVASYPYTMEHGLCYIADKKAVDMLGLTDEYENILTPEVMSNLAYLREEYLVDVFISMESNLQESTAIEIAKKLNANERIDLNYLGRIKDATGIDIQEIAKDLKDLARKPGDED